MFGPQGPPASTRNLNEAFVLPRSGLGGLGGQSRDRPRGAISDRILDRSVGDQGLRSHSQKKMKADLFFSKSAEKIRIMCGHAGALCFII